MFLNEGLLGTQYIMDARLLVFYLLLSIQLARGRFFEHSISALRLILVKS